jgi:hypothetical protein
VSAKLDDIKRSAVIGVTVALVPALALLAAPTGAESGLASGSADSARIIDRTLQCSTLGWPVRWIVVSALAPVRGQKSYEGDDVLPYAQVWTGPDGPTNSVSGASLTGMRGGTPSAGTTRTLWLRDGLCRSSSKRVRLTTRSLSGGAASPLRDSYRCITGKRVLVRIRGEFRFSASLRRNRVQREFRTGVPVERGEIAVTTVTGKPLAYLAVSEPRTARIFTAPKCVPT